VPLLPLRDTEWLLVQHPIEQVSSARQEIPRCWGESFEPSRLRVREHDRVRVRVQQVAGIP
jgi:hypothetical protein